MADYKINYYKLKNLNIVKYSNVLIVIFIIIVALIVCSFKIEITSKNKVLGIYENNILHIKVNNTLSEKLKKCEYIMINNKKANYKIIEYGEYEYINNEIYQSVYMNIDANLADREVVVLEINNDKKILAKYIFDLFK